MEVGLGRTKIDIERLMIDWHTHWNTARTAMREDEYLRHVGKTVEGRPVPEASIETMVRDVVAALRLNVDDHLLDVCCGNGLITARCAAYCSAVTGVDFSEPLIQIAKRHFTRRNVEYIVADVRRLPPTVTGAPFSKVCMYEAAQHFNPSEINALLQVLRRSRPAAPLFVGSVPDRDRRWAFYDTPARRAEYWRRVQQGTEAIGYWWTTSEMDEVGERSGYAVTILRPSPGLHVAHYRFDALLSPR